MSINLFCYFRFITNMIIRKVSIIIQDDFVSIKTDMELPSNVYFLSVASRGRQARAAAFLHRL